MRPSTTVRVALAVMGGWLAVMPHAVLTLSLRVRELDPSGLPTLYSATLAIGWLALMIGLAGFGLAGDALERRGRTRVVLVRYALPAMAITGTTLALAPTPAMLAVTWVLAQVPAAAVIATALAFGGSTTAPRRRGLLSGVVGAAPIIALLLGSAVVQAFEPQVAGSFLVTSIGGALLALPLALRQPLHSHAGPPTERRATTAAPGASAWVAFAAASFLLSWATSTTNGFVVLAVDRLSSVAEAEVTATATRSVTAAALVAVVASLLGGLAVRGRQSAAGAWSVAAVIVAAAIVGLLLQPTCTGVLVAGLAFGIGFGLANGAELGLLLFLRHRAGQLGRDLGVFTAVTTLPYVLVPAVGAALLDPDVSGVLRLLFGASAVFAVVGALITAGIAVRSPRRAGRDQQTEPEAG